MSFHISLVGRKNFSTEIYRQVRGAILNGLLSPGDPLPASRELARTLSVLIEAGVAIQILSWFAVKPIERAGIVLGYGGVPTDQIEEGLRRLRRCVRN